jgi:phage I-like protein
MSTFYDGEPVLLGDSAAAAKPVWIQLAKSGSFAGHSAGPFELNTKIFNEIIDNFRATKNRAVPIDYEHSGEQDATSGSIPINGAPAQGWIRDLMIEYGNLFGLVEWLPQAREQIRAGHYKFVSPAIRFGTKDRVTGKPAGARLSSVALTNSPFLDGMEPIAAKDTGGAPPRGSEPTARESFSVNARARAILMSDNNVITWSQALAKAAAELRKEAERAAGGVKR